MRAFAAITLCGIGAWLLLIGIVCAVAMAAGAHQ